MEKSSIPGEPEGDVTPQQQPLSSQQGTVVVEVVLIDDSATTPAQQFVEPQPLSPNVPHDEALVLHLSLPPTPPPLPPSPVGSIPATVPYAEIPAVDPV